MRPNIPALIAAGLLALPLVSCSLISQRQTPAPEKVAIPKAVPKPDITRTEAQVRRVEEKVGNVEEAVRTVGHRLEAANRSADAIEVAVEEAYANGLEAGSVQADDLRKFVVELKVELRESVEAREIAMQSLAETKGELAKTEEVNLMLRSQIEAIAIRNDNLIGALGEANKRIGTIQAIAEERDSAVKSVATKQAELNEALKYKWGVWIGIACVALYIVIRIVIVAGKWTPQGRVARFFF